MDKTKWIVCPICKNKTRVKILKQGDGSPALRASHDLPAVE